MSREFDAEIANHSKELDSLRGQMRDATNRWLDATAPYVAEFWQSFAKTTVLSQAEHSAAIGASKVQALRSEVEALAATARVYVQRRVVDERHGAWPHLAPQTDPVDGSFTSAGGSGFKLIQNLARAQTPTPLGRIMGQVLADVYAIVAQYRYTLPQDRDYGGGAVSVPAYSHPSWTPQMVQTMEAYIALHEKYISILRALATVQREKAEAAAANMWGD